MRVAVIGGTGALGSCVVRELTARGHTPVVVTRNPPAGGAGALGRGVEHRRADARGGEGLAQALEGAEAIVDAYNDRRARAGELAEASRTLLAAEAAAGVGHHVAISIVGCDRVAVGYYAAKVAQEKVVEDGPVAWSMLRATQFHELVAEIFAAAGRARLRPAGRGLIQPIDAAIVAARLVDAVGAGPSGRLPDVGGPRVQTLTELAADWRAHTGRWALPLPLPLLLLGKTGRVLRDGGLTDRDGAAGGPTFAQWLARDGAGVRGSVAR